MATIARTKYQLSKFDSNKAKTYSLVAMVKTTVSDTAIIENMNSSSVWNSDFKGAGVCKLRSNSGFEFTVEGQTYLFNSNGESAGTTSADYKLAMASIIESVGSSGNAATGTQHGSTTRGADGSIVDNGVTYEQKTLAIDSLNARDQFAVEALNSIIAKMEQDPTTLSDAAISHYCQQAYRYAAYMMTASANARGTFEDQTASTADAKKEAIGSLDSNTDKLINNLIVTLDRVQSKATVDGKEVYSQRIDFNGLDVITQALEDNNAALEALKDNVTNAMTNMQQVMTQHLGAFNNIVAKLDLIASNIISFTANLTANFQMVNDNVTSLKTDLSSVDDNVNSMVNEVTALKGTTSTINTNLNTVKSDVVVIKQNTTPRM